MEKPEASTNMDDIQHAQRRMRLRAEHKGSDLIYAVWGVIWFTAFSVQHFGAGAIGRVGPVTFQVAGIVWLPLVLVGIALTFFIARRREAVRDKHAYKYGMLWPILFGYFYLWIFLLGPLFRHEQLQSEEGILHFTAAISTVPMCVYVVLGLTTGQRFIGWLGVAVTGLVALGLYFLHDYFYLWMAFCGGGGLLLAGYISNRKWKSA